MQQILLIAVAAVFALSLARTALAQAAEIRAVTGVVELMRGEVRTALAAGEKLQSDDRIVTAAEGRAEVAFGDGSTLVIGSGSTIILRRFDLVTGQSRNGLFDLLQGIVRMALRPGPDTQVDIATQTAIASVRSTDWIVEAKADASAVFVVDGSVTVAGNGVAGSVVLGPGEGTDIKANEPPTPPKAWGPGRVLQVIERTRRP